MLLFGCKAGELPQATEVLVKVTDESFQKEVIESEQPVLVEFWAPWCHSCLEMVPDMERVAHDFAGHVKVARIRIDENPVIASEYDVDVPPAFVVFQNGKVVKRRIGMQDKDDLTKLLLVTLSSLILDNYYTTQSESDSKSHSTSKSGGSDQ
ncbi:thioredoxin family protein [Calycomorphotria hydatis]|uniref:thioredoxin family protein n=1 Tax=Calycomorphotria hydatis TaxID=2528027 RepID=UPI001E4D81BC|nr:thioredoxin domain-containing protein [Calycomorphotria hydatis]